MNKLAIVVGVGAVLTFGVAARFYGFGVFADVEPTQTFIEDASVDVERSVEPVSSAGLISSKAPLSVALPISAEEEARDARLAKFNVEASENLKRQVEGWRKVEADPKGFEEYNALIEQWAVVDASAALSHVVETAVDGELLVQLSRVLRGWASVDPSAASIWLLEHQGEEETYLWEALIEGAVKLDPKIGEALLADLTLGASRYYAARAVVRGHEGAGVAALTHWLDGTSESPAHLDLIRWAARDVGSRVPQEMIPWIMGLSVEERAVAVNGLIGRWALKDPGAAMDWAMGLNDEGIRSNAAALVIERWASMERDVAGEWLLQNLDRLDLDRAVVRYSYEQQRDDSELALSWASAIRDSALRDRTVSNLLEASRRAEKM